MSTSNPMDQLGLETIRAVLFGDVRLRDRNHAEVQWRVPGDPEKTNVRILTGYPAVFGQTYTLYESDQYIITEEVAPGFFDDVLKDDCHLNYSHQSPSAMCRNNLRGPGGMELSVDSHGFRVYAEIPMDDLDAQRIAPKMDRGVVDQMSYAFSVAEEDRLETKDETGRYAVHYTLKKCRRLYDVCVTPLGANAQTEAVLRSLAGQLMGRSLEEGSECDPDRADEAGSEAPEESRSVEGSLAKRRAVLETEAALAVLAFKPRP